MGAKYPFPDFLNGVCTPEKYRRWLNGRAVAHRARDVGRGNTSATAESYRIAIHAAVVSSGGVDAYTGLPLRWDLLGTYSSAESAAGGRAYKQGLGNLPSVDHVGDGLGPPDFVICAWRVNDAKSDLTRSEFIELCRVVIAHHDSPPAGTRSLEQRV